MKNTLLVSSILMAISSSAFAHHPAADIVDPEIYAMIDENVSDTPHADLTFDDMGSDMETAGAAAEARASSVDTDAVADAAMEAEEMVDTIDLLENVASSLAE